MRSPTSASRRFTGSSWTCSRSSARSTRCFRPGATAGQGAADPAGRSGSLWAMDWLGFFVPRFKLRKQPPESFSPPREDDLERLHELREMGSRLNLPHPVRAFLALPSEARAREAG